MWKEVPQNKKQQKTHKRRKRTQTGTQSTVGNKSVSCCANCKVCNLLPHVDLQETKSWIIYFQLTTTLHQSRHPLVLSSVRWGQGADEVKRATLHSSTTSTTQICHSTTLHRHTLPPLHKTLCCCIFIYL